MRKALSIFVFCIANNVIGANIDSLLKVISAHKIDSAYCLILTNLSGKYEDIGDYEKAIASALRAKKIADSIHYKIGVQAALNSLGGSYLDKGDVKKALEYHLAALKVREELDSKLLIAYSYLNLGNTYFRLGQEDEALNDYQHSIDLMFEMRDTVNAAICLTNMGSIYSNRGEVKKAQELYTKALNIRKRFNDIDGIAEIYSNLSVTFMDAKRYKEALQYAFETLPLYGENGSKLGKAIAYSNIGDIYEHMNDLPNAIKYQEIAMQLSIEMKTNFMLETCYQLLAVAYSKKSDYKNAVKYAELFSQVRDSIMNSENGKMISEMQTRFETGKKEKEIELLQKDKSIRDLEISKQDSSIKRQRIIIFTIIGGLILVITLITLILRSNRERKKINLGLEKKNAEIEFQKDQIGEKNKMITDSIDYARTIQNAILPPEDKIKEAFPESFIVYEPKDIVSGDFYWLGEVKDTILFATVDCAGEGVPGAFMSILVNSLLENIALEKKLIDPALIVEELNKSKYKVDTSVISWNKSQNELKFAGTKMPLVIIRDSKINKVIPENEKTQTISLKKGDMIYMFTDGAKKGTEFLEVLTSISQKDLQQQKEILQKKAKSKSDDVLVVGIRVN
jgi:tetratricopeptide (TPR) repeat protein/serine phosphatase RsbU (regulator of sigma subunit)